MKKWLNANAGLLVLGLIVLLIWSWLPSPWNLRYLVKRALFRPTFVCRDSTVSWARTSQGACSGHGGPARRYE